MSGAGQFSAGSNFPPFELELRYAAGDGRVLHALDIVLLLLRQTVAWIPQPPSLQFFIPPRLPAATHSRLPSPFPPYFAILSPPLRSLKRIIVRGIKLFPSPICTSSSSPFRADPPDLADRSLSRLIGRFCAQPFLEAAGCTGNYYRSTSP